MNVHDSERMSGLLDQAGYEPTSDDLDADVIVINTCSVREHAEDKLYTRLGELRVLGEETGRRPLVAVAGCVAQQEGRALLTRTNGHVIDVVVGTQRLKMLPVLLEKAAQTPFAEVDINPWDDVSFPLGRRSGQGVRHDYRGVQRSLRLLRGSAHPWARTDARQGGHSGGRAAGS
jgi:tRNA-2-methylthio-N6-dimethylallyladenosine synthase